MLDKSAILEKFTLGTKTVALESIDGEVKIKRLNIAQRQEVNDVLFGEAKIQKAGKNMEIEVTRYNRAALLGVSYGLVEPKLTQREISQLSESANDFLNEVFNAIQEFDEPKK